MGQYYKPINLDKKQWLYSHDFKTRYKRGDEIIYIGQGLKLMEHSWIGNPFVETVETLLIPGGDWYKNRIVWAGDYADDEPKKKANLWTIFDTKDTKIKPKRKKLAKKYRYICNHDKKVFIDKENIRKSMNGWKIHPLPLLTCEGNGRGGGDFHGEDDRIGSWARDRISVESEIPKGFTEMDGTFIEE